MQWGFVFVLFFLTLKHCCLHRSAKSHSATPLVRRVCGAFHSSCVAVEPDGKWSPLHFHFPLNFYILFNFDRQKKATRLLAWLHAATLSPGSKVFSVAVWQKGMLHTAPIKNPNHRLLILCPFTIIFLRTIFHQHVRFNMWRNKNTAPRPTPLMWVFDRKKKTHFKKHFGALL